MGSEMEYIIWTK